MINQPIANIRMCCIKCVFGLAFAALRFNFYVFSFFFFSFFLFHAFFPSQAATVHVLYMNSSRNIWPVLREQCIHALFTNPQISFFINFFIKNGSHGTIDTFKNYFATVFSVFSFQFQQNKFYSNTPYDEQILHGEFKRQTPII